MTIKHLVISGGGPSMIQTLGVIQHLEDQAFICLKNIESIYGTSSGAIVGVLISLGYDWETINDYIIKRPWQDVFNISVQTILDAYTKKGIFDIKTIEKCFKPLFDAKDISMDITLADFHKLSSVELHFISFELNEYKIHDISYLTHPQLPILTAIQMTCSLPVLVTPVCMDEKCYIDGGVSCNYPVNYCIESGKISDEILGIKNVFCGEQTSIGSSSTIIDFLLNFIFKAVYNVNTDHTQQHLKNEVICDVKSLSFDVLRRALSSVDVRRDLRASGINSAETFISKLKDSV